MICSRKTGLVEVFRAPEDLAVHKNTADYQQWNETIADIMVEPCSSIKYGNV